MRCLILGFVAGILFLQCQPTLPPYAVLGSCAACAICLLVLTSLAAIRTALKG